MADIIKRFNGLGAAPITREELTRLYDDAVCNGEWEVVSRIEKVLQTYPEADNFHLEVDNPIEAAKPAGLGAPRHKGMEKQALDECGRLKPGYYYLKGGIIMKSGSPKPALKKKKKIQPASKKEITVIVKKPLRRKPKKARKTPVKAIVIHKAAATRTKAKRSRRTIVRKLDHIGILDRINAHQVRSFSGDFPKYNPAYSWYFIVLSDHYAIQSHNPKAKIPDLFRIYDLDYNFKGTANILLAEKLETFRLTKSDFLNWQFVSIISSRLNAPEPQTQETVLPEIEAVEMLLQPEETELIEPVIMPHDIPMNDEARGLMEMEFNGLQMTDGWEGFIQDPPMNMKIAYFGKPKNGKTAGALAFACYLTRFGDVLYNFADQGFNKSTRDLWILSGMSTKANATPSDVMTLDGLEKLCASGKYDFVFIDMINAYIDREKLKPHEFVDRFIRKYPDIGFHLVMEVTKNGNFKGDQGWTHIVDSIVTTENFLMENRGRYGVGHYIVWEEGLKKFDPEKYDELAGEQPDPIDAEITQII